MINRTGIVSSLAKLSNSPIPVKNSFCYCSYICCARTQLIHASQRYDSSAGVSNRLPGDFTVCKQGTNLSTPLVTCRRITPQSLSLNPRRGRSSYGTPISSLMVGRQCITDSPGRHLRYAASDRSIAYRSLCQFTTSYPRMLEIRPRAKEYH